jgi:tetratricopeptide (TPR) repeat protein
MKPRLLFAIALLAFMVVYAFKLSIPRNAANFNFRVFKQKTIVSCSPDWNELQAWIDESDIPPIPGAGIYKWKISTKNDSAQFYFNQGINTYYGFHIIEAMASFKKALQFDPECAMIYWAQALAYGPNINDFGYRASPEALAALSKADKFSSTASAFEKDLIGAMAIRYTSDSADVSRVMLNQAYTDMMKKVYEKYTANADAQALYADAMMLQHPWDLWYIDGKPKPWTPLIRKVLEQLLKKSPNHPGANHYYIHVMEPSPFAALALPSADRLGKLNPGLSHLVHMPSHIYLRTGFYKKGIDVNTNAVNSYQKSIALYAPVTGADFLYLIHNLHMKANNAMLLGDAEKAAGAATETVQSIPKDYFMAPAPMGNYVQYISMTPVLINIRFELWDKILQQPKPDAALVYSNILYHFGRGFAFSYKQQFDEAAKELDLMREQMKDSSLQVPFTPFAPAIDGARVAEQMLLGIIHQQRKLYDGAIKHFKAAAEIEATMVYNEPRDWLLNPKTYLGNAYLENNDGSNAEKVFLQDLQNNNENRWALQGLYKALQLQKKDAAAVKVMARLKKAL